MGYVFMHRKVTVVNKYHTMNSVYILDLFTDRVYKSFCYVFDNVKDSEVPFKG